ncbi:MAG: nickel pincer cofactor biosynthesis protein LarC [Candidatus Thermoplasmatota archaeon]
MRIAYFDCFSGIAGDMILGALIDAGCPIRYLKKELNKLCVKDYSLNIKRVEYNHISGVDVQVEYQDTSTPRNLSDINDIIINSDLDESVRNLSLRIFHRLAEAESRVHNTAIDKVHFHEVGAIDSIIDIVGSVICYSYHNIDEVYSSSLPMGSGFVDCSHGLIPLPAPATVELVKGVPVYSDERGYELVTPTGAAILTTLARYYGRMPLMRIRSVGYGAGKTMHCYPNMLRVFMGELIQEKERSRNDDES